MRTQLFIVVLITALSPLRLKAVDWSRVIDLTGNWSFTVGDDASWSKPETKTDDWDPIGVPDRWEQFYPDYNGYAWYRKEFDATVIPGNGQLTLFLGRIDDVDEVFINGVKVGQTGGFFPNYRSAYDVERQYQLPVGLIKPGKNLIAVRVYDEAHGGGMVGGQRIGVYYDNDNELIVFDLSGSWKFSIYRDRNFYQKDFNDKNWADLMVPGVWEEQGFAVHDGYGWYRKQFVLPPAMINGDYFLVLGKIDDRDKVYLNGKLIGRTEDLPDYLEYNKAMAYKFNRAYRIPQGLLQRTNVVAIEVFDDRGDGGIYEGPIGLAKPADARIILDRRVDNDASNTFRSIIRYILE